MFQGERYTLVQGLGRQNQWCMGVTKLAGRKKHRTCGLQSTSSSAPWLYSHSAKNFVKYHATAHNQPRHTLKVVFDQVGTPTYAGDLAAVIYKGDYREPSRTNRGIYHFSSRGSAHVFDFARKYELSGNTCDIQPCHSMSFQSKVKRPHFSVLDKTKVKSTFDVKVLIGRTH